jgi:diaminopimelate epimerase
VEFHKYHGLGNDYLVLDPSAVGRELTVREIRIVCDRNYGIGSDGILWGPLAIEPRTFGVRVFNPDGSEAEKSGNGLRIFSRYLFDRALVKTDPFTVVTAGGQVTCRVHPGGKLIDVEMGRVSFDAGAIPVRGLQGEVINQRLVVGGREFVYCAATIGNPHCVLPLSEVSADLARTFGPLIENDPRFPNRTNVQFLQVLDRATIRIEIWERGAGYTLASGSSSSAAAAVARRLGLCDGRITVQMPGGALDITVGDDYSIQMTGPVTSVGSGTISDEIFEPGPEG